MGICILCREEKSRLYGDNRLNQILCDNCYNKCSCLYCKKLNINIYVYDENIGFNNKYNYDIVIKSFYGKKFKLYCKDCYESKDPYKEVVEYAYSIEEYIPKIELKRMREEAEKEINSDEETDIIDDYYVRRGKYDLY